MIKNPTAKNWKQTHHSGKNSRKNSIEDLNDSAMSNHSSLSTGYNRFKFQPRDTPNNKRQNIFQYTSRNKEQPFDISELANKKSEAMGSRKSLDVLVPQRDSLVRLDSFKEDITTHRIKSKPVKDLAKELKFLTTSLKRTIQYFAKQLKQLKNEWDSSIKQLLKYQISLENTAILQLRECLQKKQKEIAKFKDDFANIDKKIVYKESAFKIRHAQSHNQGTSLSNLGISKIEAARSNEAEEKLSGNNTLNSLLGQKPSNPAQITLGYCRDSQGLIVMKQAVRRMREVLDSNG